MMQQSEALQLSWLRRLVSKSFQIILSFSHTNNLAYLHRNRIIHRDIKPENILLKSKESIQIKIADFGLACYADVANGISNIAGTPLFMAPEIVQKLGYNHSCDIWSIGIMLYLFLCGYEKNAEATLHEMVKSGKIEYPVELWQNIDIRGIGLYSRNLTYMNSKKIVRINSKI
jgi:serine/threonine protein kinase